jgi:hypothetical protein
MLQLDDAVLARLIRAAGAVDVRHRRRWLREIADRLDPPTADVARRRRVEDVKRFRERRRRGASVYSIEIDSWVLDLAEHFVGLAPGQAGDRQAVADALGKLLRLALVALMRPQNKDLLTR